MSLVKHKACGIGHDVQNYVARSMRLYMLMHVYVNIFCLRVRVNVCMCVCVCARARQSAKSTYTHVFSKSRTNHRMPRHETFFLRFSISTLYTFHLSSYITPNLVPPPPPPPPRRSLYGYLLFANVAGTILFLYGISPVTALTSPAPLPSAPLQPRNA